MQIIKKSQKLVFTALMAALLAIASPFILPFGPIPFSLSLLCVFFIGFVLPPLQACMSVLLYLLLGCIGLPIFSGFQGGPHVLVGPTGGYLIGYFAIVLATAHASKHTSNFLLLLLAALSGLISCYALGTAWFMFITRQNLLSALTICVFPFILPDTIKAVLALLLSKQLLPRLQKGLSYEKPRD